ncbi:hypothetical protein VTL71DRAFT_11641 [Oculimacula yallundae]|uniref:Uncharacterized protein n=1 Tax=Oculimacula yallundae TaxID=86028 RepID=A0ABR4CRA4_9HELO
MQSISLPQISTTSSFLIGSKKLQEIDYFLHRQKPKVKAQSSKGQSDACYNSRGIIVPAAGIAQEFILIYSFTRIYTPPAFLGQPKQEIYCLSALRVKQYSSYVAFLTLLDLPTVLQFTNVTSCTSHLLDSPTTTCVTLHDLHRSEETGLQLKPCCVPWAPADVENASTQLHSNHLTRVSSFVATTSEAETSSRARSRAIET